LIDRGGHRPKDVDYIVAKVPFLKAYIGLTRVDPKKELIYKSDNGEYFLGQSETLSELVGLHMDTSLWFIPHDTDDEFVRQATGHYFIKKRDVNGNTKTIWVKDPIDHYRSCLNQSYAAAKLLNLDIALFKSDIVVGLQNVIYGTEPVKKEEKLDEEEIKKEYYQSIRNNNYYSRALGAR
jgi:hypothetical protein